MSPSFCPQAGSPWGWVCGGCPLHSSRVTLPRKSCNWQDWLLWRCWSLSAPFGCGLGGQPDLPGCGRGGQPIPASRCPSDDEQLHTEPGVLSTAAPPSGRHQLQVPPSGASTGVMRDSIPPFLRVRWWAPSSAAFPTQCDFDLAESKRERAVQIGFWVPPKTFKCA